MFEGSIQNVSDKGFGFIEVEGYDKNVFFHASECKGIRFEQLRKGDKVTLRDIKTSPRGYSAEGVALAD